MASSFYLQSHALTSPGCKISLSEGNCKVGKTKNTNFAYEVKGTDSFVSPSVFFLFLIQKERVEENVGKNFHDTKTQTKVE